VRGARFVGAELSDVVMRGERAETTLSCLHVILKEEWEHHP
jgi:hypothetical protein